MQEDKRRGLAWVLMIYVQWRRIDRWMWEGLLMGAYFLRPVENVLADDRSIIKKSGIETWHPSVFISAEIIVLFLFAAVTLAAALIHPTFHLLVPLVFKRFQAIAHLLHCLTRYKPELFARQGNDRCLHAGLCPPPPTQRQEAIPRLLLRISIHGWECCFVTLIWQRWNIFSTQCFFRMIIPSVWQMTGYICKSLRWETIVGQHVG